MPDSEQLFANDHMSGETVVFNLKDPLKPRVPARFRDLAVYRASWDATGSNQFRSFMLWSSSI